MRYDTIRCIIFTRASQKINRYQKLTHGTKRKITKTKTKNRIAQKKWSGQATAAVSQPPGRTDNGYPYCIHSFAFRKLRFILRSGFLIQKYVWYSEVRFVNRMCFFSRKMWHKTQLVAVFLRKDSSVISTF